MAKGRVTVRTGEAIVLRSWPFGEADLLISLFTRDFGKVKGVARHAMRSRRRFGGALEPMTHVRANWAERPRQELARMDAFEIVSSPLSAPVDLPRLAALELLAEVLDELPEGLVDDAVFRLSLTVLEQLSHGRICMPVTYFALWMNRLMGWMPGLGRCVVCGTDLRGGNVWYSPTGDGVTCADDRQGSSLVLSAAGVREATRIFHGTLAELTAAAADHHGPELRHFAVALLERHLERRLRSAGALQRLED